MLLGLPPHDLGFGELKFGQSKKVENITKAVVALHNFVIISEQSMPAGSRLYIPPGYADYEDR